MLYTRYLLRNILTEKIIPLVSMNELRNKLIAIYFSVYLFFFFNNLKQKLGYK